MKATGNLQTIVILDCGEHGRTVTATARKYAPGAVVDYRECGTGENIDYQAVKRELRKIADNPGRVNTIVLAWGLPGWIDETIPPWAIDPEKGMEAELKAVVEAGVTVVAAAGDDSQGKIGANYPACSPWCIPAMGSAEFCNRTRRGLVCSESSASRAAAELAGALAMVHSVDGDYVTLLRNSKPGTFETLDVVMALAALGAEPDYEVPTEMYAVFFLKSGRYEFSVNPELKVTRYTKDGRRERFGSITGETDRRNRITIGITGRGDYQVTFRRAA